MSRYYYSDPTASQPRQQRTPWTSVLWPLVWLLGLVIFLVWWLGPRWHQGIDSNASPRAVAPRGDLGDDEKQTIDLFKKASPSVVHITTLALRQDFFTMDVQQIPQGTGSGFIWDDAGHIVTNYHVIQKANAAKVTLSDQTSYDAQTVGVYPDKDLAVLWINAPKSKLVPIPVGTSHDLQVGQKAFAIGNPFGLDHTLTKGIVSAVGREIKSVTNRGIRDAIQTDAAINPGNSGGPLLDSDGRLIGVNTQIYSPSGSSAGIGFAIPVDEVNRVVPQLIRHGKVIRPGLGINPAEDQVMRRASLEGVLVLSIKPGSPAAQAGLRPTRRSRTGDILLGDIILAINGKLIKSKDDYYTTLEEHKIGEAVTLTIMRNDEKQEVQVTLGTAGEED